MVVIGLAGCGEDPEPSVDVRTMTDPCTFFTAKELETLRLNEGHLLDTGGGGTQPSASDAKISPTSSAGTSSACVHFSMIQSSSAGYYLHEVLVTVAKVDVAAFIAGLQRRTDSRLSRVPERGYYRSEPHTGADSSCDLVFVANASTVVHLEITVLPNMSGQASKRGCEVVSELAPFIERRIPPQPAA